MNQQIWHIEHHDLCDHSDCARTLTVAIPAKPKQSGGVVFLTDGQFTEHWIPNLESSVLHSFPILVGVHSHESARAEEYLLNDGEEFERHEEYFVHELREFLKNEYGLKCTSDQSVVFGFSNGGAFALTVALRHPALYSTAICFSVPKLLQMPTIVHTAEHQPFFYLASGTIGPEKAIRKNVNQIAGWLRKRNMKVRVTERKAGHDFSFWSSEFPIALLDMEAKLRQ